MFLCCTALIQLVHPLIITSLLFGHCLWYAFCNCKSVFVCLSRWHSYRFSIQNHSTHTHTALEFYQLSICLHIPQITCWPKNPLQYVPKAVSGLHFAGPETTLKNSDYTKYMLHHPQYLMKNQTQILYQSVILLLW